MCYNKDVSLYTYLIGLVASFLLIQKKDKDLKILGCFFIVIIHMQIIEYFLWTNNKCNMKNITLSHLGAVTLFIQPIILYLAIIYYNNELYIKNKVKINSILIIYIILLSIYSIHLFPLGCTSVTKLSSPYLQWSWFYKKNPELLTLCFPLALTILVYYGLTPPYNLYVSLLCILSFIVSYIIYNKKRVFGTLWCWFAVFIPIGLLIIDTFSNL